MRFDPVANIESVVARSAPVRADIRARGGEMLAAAKVEKATHVDRGDSFVEGSMGRTDYSVTLDDTRGQAAAMAMEFGSSGDATGRGTLPQRIVTGPHVAAAAAGDSRG